MIHLDKALEAWESPEVIKHLDALSNLWLRWAFEGREWSGQPGELEKIVEIKGRVRAVCQSIEDEFESRGAFADSRENAKTEDKKTFRFFSAPAPSHRDWDYGHAERAHGSPAHPLVSALRCHCEDGALFLLNELGSPSVLRSVRRAPLWAGQLAAKSSPASDALLRALAQSAANREGENGAVLQALAWVEGALSFSLRGPQRSNDSVIGELRRALSHAAPYLAGDGELPVSEMAVEGTFEWALCGMATSAAAELSQKDALARAVAQIEALMEIAPLSRWPSSELEEGGFFKNSPPEELRDLTAQKMGLAARVGAWWAIDILERNGAPRLTTEQIERIDWSCAGMDGHSGGSSVIDLLYDLSRTRALLDSKVLAQEIKGAEKSADSAPVKKTMRI